MLEAVGVKREEWNGKRKWINFESADELSEGKYATSIPLDYALDRGMMFSLPMKWYVKRSHSGRYI